MINNIYEVTNLDDVDIWKIEDTGTKYRLYPLQYGDIIQVNKHVVKSKLKVGKIWSEYPMLKCVRRIYERHKWWQFWKWHKLIGYDVMYIGKD